MMRFQTKKHRLLAGAMAAACCLTLTAPLAASAKTVQVADGYLGDINGDDNVTVADAVLLLRHLLNKEPLTGERSRFADVNQDSEVNAYDLSAMKAICLGLASPTLLYTTVEEPDAELIPAPIAKLSPSLPSIGEVRVPIFSIDFPDCSFSNKRSVEQLTDIVFGPEDASNPMYPCESITAYFDRASYGNLHLTGDVYTYTAKNSVSSYVSDKDSLLKEVLNAYADTVDFAIYDADNNGTIDCSAYFVPPAAGDDNWWPCSGGFGDYWYTVDGLRVGNVLIGNTDPDSDYVGTMTHELGHAMGLPDYYKYNTTTNFEGLNGEAGHERMDEATGDFSSFSRLMLGWLRSDEVQVYDGSASQSFQLSSISRTGGCVIIPKGNLDENYFSEYFVVEYVTPENNYANSWFRSSGIRVLHVQAELGDSAWGTILAYENYSPQYDASDNGIRVMRLVNDGNGFSETGAVINSSTAGFGWYDTASQQPTIDPGVSISVGALTDGSYTVTVSQN